MQSAMKILLTAGLSAAAMYLLDPADGKRRRARARARLEDGRDSLVQGANKAAEGVDKAARQARDLGHDASKRTDGIVESLRDLGHEIGERAAQLMLGATAAGRVARDRASATAHSVGSAVERHRPHRSASRAPAVKVLRSPVTWVVTVGVGAAAMYFFDPSQGLYRRAKLRKQVDDLRAKLLPSRSRETRAETAIDEPSVAQPGGNGSGRDLHERDASLRS